MLKIFILKTRAKCDFNHDLSITPLEKPLQYLITNKTNVNHLQVSNILILII